ncbi:MAG TPA: type II toxin-antitoxin system Phd/YefM family antitoxin [Polyangiaceae bacterium]
MKSVAISDFKAHCLSLLDDVARTGEPLLVTRRGKPLARVSPGVDASSGYPQDTLAGTVVELDDIVAPAVPRGRWSVLGERRRRSRT